MLHMSCEGADDRRRDIWTPVTPQEISPSLSYIAKSSSVDTSVSAASCPGQASSCQLTCATATGQADTTQATPAL